MTRLQQTSAVDADPRLANDDPRVVMLRNCGVLDSTVNREFDRWTTALRRNSGAAVAAICFFDVSRQLIKSVTTDRKSADQVTELAPTESLQTYTVGLADSTDPTTGRSLYADAVITVAGHVRSEARRVG